MCLLEVLFDASRIRILIDVIDFNFRNLVIPVLTLTLTCILIWSDVARVASSLKNIVKMMTVTAWTMHYAMATPKSLYHDI